MLASLFPYNSSTLRLCWSSYSGRGDGTKPSHGESAKPFDKNLDDRSANSSHTSNGKVFQKVPSSDGSVQFARGLLVAYLHQGTALPHNPQAIPVLAATLGLDDGSQTSTTEGARWDRIFVEYRHRSHESCQGDLQCHTSQGCFRLGQHPPYNGQGTILVSCDWNSHA